MSSAATKPAPAKPQHQDGAVFGRLPPQNIEAEQAVIGSMLIDNDVIADVLPLINADSFLRDAHQKSYKAVVDLHSRDGAVDPLTLFDELKRRGQLCEPGQGELTAEYISDILANTPTAANATYYAKIVADKAMSRAAIILAATLAREAYDGSRQAHELVEEMRAKLQAVADGQAIAVDFTLE